LAGAAAAAADEGLAAAGLPAEGLLAAGLPGEGLFAAGLLGGEGLFAAGGEPGLVADLSAMVIWVCRSS